MPGRRFRDTYTGDVYDVPWSESRDPNDDEIEQLIDEQKRRSMPEPAPKKNLFQRINQPLTNFASRQARKVSDVITRNALAQEAQPNYFQNPVMRGLENFGRKSNTYMSGLTGGMLEGVGNLGDEATNPVDIAATLTGLKGVRTAGKAGSRLYKAGSALTGARGLYNVGEGVSSGITDEGFSPSNVDYGKIATGALETVLSAHGFDFRTKEAGAPTSVLPREIPEQKRLGAGARFYGYGDQVADIRTTPDPAARQADIDRIRNWQPPKRLGTGTTYEGLGGQLADVRGDPLANKKLIDEAARRGILDPSKPSHGPVYSGPQPIRPKQPLPDIDITPLRKEIETKPVPRPNDFVRPENVRPPVPEKAIIKQETNKYTNMSDAVINMLAKVGDEGAASEAARRATSASKSTEIGRPVTRLDSVPSIMGKPIKDMTTDQLTNLSKMEELDLDIISGINRELADRATRLDTDGPLSDWETNDINIRRLKELTNKSTAGTLTGDELKEAQKLNKIVRDNPLNQETRPFNQKEADRNAEWEQGREHSKIYEGRNDDVRVPLTREQQLVRDSYERMREHSMDHAAEFSRKEELLPEGEFYKEPPELKAKYEAEQATLKAAHEKLVNRLFPKFKNLNKESLPDIDTTDYTMASRNTNLTNPVGPVQPIPVSDKRSGARKLFEGATKSGLTQLEDMGESGKKIARTYQYLRAESNYEAGKRINQLRQASDDFTPNELTNLFDVIDGTASPITVRVKSAADIGKRILDETGEEAEKLGMRLHLPSGKKIPFTRITGPYAPHVFDKSLFEGANKDVLVNKLVNSGKTVAQANQVIQTVKNYGDRFVDPADLQLLNLKNYRRDPDAINKYLTDMWQKIGEAKHLGVGDLDDTTSPISKLIAKTSNPQEAYKIIHNQLGRNVHDLDMEKFVHGVNTAQVAMKLPLFAISNLSQRATPLLKASVGDYVKAIKSTVLDKAGAKTHAEISGSLQAVNKQLFQDTGGESRISKLYQMKTSESANRVFTSEVGRNTVQRVFDTLKKNPNDKMARKRLDDLLLEDVDTVLKQGDLTDKQRSIASYRMNELTQGITDNIDLPQLWSAHPSVKLLTLFRKFAFVQTKIIKDAIKENPTRNIPIALLAYAAAGEAVGDIKTGISSLVAGKDPEEEIKKRGQYKEIGHITSRILNDKQSGAIVGRLAQNLADGFAFGLLDDALSSSFSGKPSGFAEFLGGVNVGDVSKLAGGVARGVQGIGKSTKAVVRPPLREATRMLPFGRSITNRIDFLKDDSGIGGRPSRESGRPSR